MEDQRGQALVSPQENSGWKDGGGREILSITDAPLLEIDSVQCTQVV